MKNLLILHFRNPWNYGFLEKVSFTLFYGILCPQQQYVFGYVYRIKFKKKIKHTYFKATQRISCTTIHDYNQAHMKAEKICYKMDMTNSVCRGGALHFKIWASCRSPISTGCDLVPCQCTLVENDNFYYVRVVSQRLSNCPSSRFCGVPTLHNPEHVSIRRK